MNVYSGKATGLMDEVEMDARFHTFHFYLPQSHSDSGLYLGASFIRSVCFLVLPISLNNTESSCMVVQSYNKHSEAFSAC